VQQEGLGQLKEMHLIRTQTRDPCPQTICYKYKYETKNEDKFKKDMVAQAATLIEQEPKRMLCQGN
jgi:hypothetical protein